MSPPGAFIATVDRGIGLAFLRGMPPSCETQYDGGVGIARPGESSEPEQLENTKVMEEGELKLPQRDEDFQEEREVIF